MVVDIRALTSLGNADGILGSVEGFRVLVVAVLPTAGGAHVGFLHEGNLVLTFGADGLVGGAVGALVNGSLSGTTVTHTFTPAWAVVRT